jgi:hypothetical protein
MANHLTALDWQLQTVPRFRRARKPSRSNDSQLSLQALVANNQAVALTEAPEKRRLGRPVRLKLWPDRETQEQRAERLRVAEDYAEEIDHASYLRPRRREDCMPIRRALVDHIEDGHPYKTYAPCPFVSCVYHLHLDVHRTGDSQGVIEFFDTDIKYTCALDVADEGGVKRAEIADVLGMTEDRTLAMEKLFMARMRVQGAFRRDLSDDDRYESP